MLVREPLGFGAVPGPGKRASQQGTPRKCLHGPTRAVVLLERGDVHAHGVDVSAGFVEDGPAPGDPPEDRRTAGSVFDAGFPHHLLSIVEPALLGERPHLERGIHRNHDRRNAAFRGCPGVGLGVEQPPFVDRKHRTAAECAGPREGGAAAMAVGDGLVDRLAGQVEGLAGEQRVGGHVPAECLGGVLGDHAAAAECP